MKENPKLIYLLEVLNSVTWFIMDGSWMLDYQSVAYFFAFPTIITGFFAIFISRKAVDKGINFTILAWILMNVSWLLSEANPWIKENNICLALFFISLGSMLVTFVLSDYSLESFRRLRRLRIRDKGSRGLMPIPIDAFQKSKLE
jgi:uncharacterized membrane protein YhdT